MKSRSVDISGKRWANRIRPGQQFQVETNNPCSGFKGEAVRDYFGSLYFRSSFGTPDSEPQLVHWSKVATLHYLDPLARQHS